MHTQTQQSRFARRGKNLVATLAAALLFAVAIPNATANADDEPIRTQPHGADHALSYSCDETGRAQAQADYDAAIANGDEPAFTFVTADPMTGEFLGTMGDDVIYGTSNDDYIRAFAGDDYICALAGEDTIIGDKGDDWIHAGDDNDWVDGGQGWDSILGRGGNDWLFGGDGNDWISGANGNDSILGRDGNDLLLGGADDDWMSGGNGRDDIRGENGHDYMLGGNQQDVLNGGEGNDQLIGEKDEPDADGNWGGDDYCTPGPSDPTSPIVQFAGATCEVVL